MDNTFFNRRLTALRYPNRSAFDYKNKKLRRELVVWLEGCKICALSKDERKGLKNTTNKNWLNSLNDYLDALDYEHDPDEKWDNKKWFEVIVLYD